MTFLTPGLAATIRSILATTESDRWRDAPAGRFTARAKYPLSSVGTNPPGIVLKSITIKTRMTAKAARKVFGRPRTPRTPPR